MQPQGGTQHMHIRGGKSDIFGSEYHCLKKTATMFMIFFDTKHCLTDISGFARGNHDFYLHCFGIFHVHVRVYVHKMS